LGERRRLERPRTWAVVDAWWSIVLDQEGGATDRALPGTVVLSDRLATFKRVYRWLNLTLIQQGLWALLVLLAGAPAESVEGTPMPWYLARLAAPAAAALLAFVYLRQRPLGPLPVGGELGGQTGALATQARFALLVLPLMVVAARLVAGPAIPALKLALYGLADVAAFHLINFGVVARSYPRAEQGRTAAVFLFGLSWALRETMLVGVGVAGGSLAIAFLGGLIAGLVVALAALWLRERLGALPAAAAHWLVVYLILGFVD
jgi:hypothetical protein